MLGLKLITGTVGTAGSCFYWPALDMVLGSRVSGIGVVGL